MLEMEVVKAVNNPPILPIISEADSFEFFDLRRWLSPPTSIYAGEYYQDEYNRAYSLKTEGTCLWIRQEKSYNTWRHTEANGLLWISGPPGSGKTVLVASIVADLQSAPHLLYFFCRENDDYKRTSIAVFRSLLFQLWAQTRKEPKLVIVWREILQTFDFEKFSYQPNYLRALRMILNHLVGVFILIDGVDECEDRELLIPEICKLLHDAERSVLKTRLKFLIASRPDPNIRRAFTKFSCMEITTRKTKLDVGLMLQSRVKTAIEGGASWLEEPAITSMLIRRLKQKAEGMYMP